MTIQQSKLNLAFHLCHVRKVYYLAPLADQIYHNISNDHWVHAENNTWVIHATVLVNFVFIHMYNEFLFFPFHTFTIQFLHKNMEGGVIVEREINSEMLVIVQH